MDVVVGKFLYANFSQIHQRAQTCHGGCAKLATIGVFDHLCYSGVVVFVDKGL